MNQSHFIWLIALLGFGFALVFGFLVLPPLLINPDILGAFAAGFVNPFSSGYAIDAIMCWMILAVWVIFEAKTKAIKHGWLALLLGIVPGVATGFAVYLIMRIRQKADL